MARAFTGGSTNPPHLRKSAAALGLANGCSIACWFSSDLASGGPRYIAGWGNGSRLLGLVQSGNKLGLGDKGPGSPINGMAVSGNTFAAGTWNHAVGIIVADNDRRVVLNGDIANKGTSNPGSAFVAATDVWVGANVYELNGFASGFDGRVACLAIYAEILPDDAIAALSSGIHPRQVRAHKLRFLAELSGRRDPETELSRGAGLSLFNAPAYADGPRFIGSRRRVVTVAAADGAGTAVPVAGIAASAELGSSGIAYGSRSLVTSPPATGAVGQPVARVDGGSGPAGLAAAIGLGGATIAIDSDLVISVGGIAAQGEAGTANGHGAVALIPGGLGATARAGGVQSRWSGMARPTSPPLILIGGGGRAQRRGWGDAMDAGGSWVSLTVDGATWSPPGAVPNGWAPRPAPATGWSPRPRQNGEWSS